MYGYFAATAITIISLIILDHFRVKRRCEKYKNDLNEKSNKYRLFYDISPIMLHSIDANGKLIEINDEWLKVMGYAKHEVLGRESITFMTQESKEKAIKLFPFLFKNGFLYKTPYQLVKKNGDIIDTLFTAHYEKDNEGNFKSASAAILNVTTSKKVLREKEQLEMQLHHTQKLEAVGTLAGGIAHDFNNILSSILGFTELAKLKAGEDQALQGYFNHILDSGERAKNLTQNLLTFSRRASVDKKVLQVAPLLKQTVKLIRATAPSSTISLECTLNDQNCCILADSTQMHQVFMNLLANAIHSMKETGGVLRVEVNSIEITEDEHKKVEKLSPGKYVQFTVIDSGHGIPKNTIQKIFDPFFTTKNSDEGTGLGLSITYGIIKEMKGSINVESSEGVGTTFTILLPESSSKESHPADVEISHIITGTGKILLVDDEVHIVKWTSELLTSLGYTVVTAATAVEALETFLQTPDSFDLVLTDLTMPKMLGTELAKKISNIRPQLPIILCTGFSEGLTAEVMNECGISKVLMKPVLASRLSQVTSYYLSKAPALSTQDELSL